jgi:hypothetical protein
MDTLVTPRPGVVHHHSAQGFCTVCGTAWPCWRGLREDSAGDGCSETRVLLRSA